MNLNSRSQEGFTLIETLLSLTLTSMIILLFSTGLNQTNEIRDTIKNDHQMEWHLFLHQLQFELDRSVQVSNTQTTMELNQREGNSVRTYRLNQYPYNNNTMRMLRRQTQSGTGHQPMLTRMKSLSFEKRNKVPILIVRVEFIDGQEYKANLYVSSWDEKQ